MQTIVDYAPAALALALLIILLMVLDFVVKAWTHRKRRKNFDDEWDKYITNVSGTRDPKRRRMRGCE